MVRQHLYRLGPDGGQTIAASEGLKDSAWLALLEAQLGLLEPGGLSVPVYYQYPLGRGLVLSCCVPAPDGEAGAYQVHQLVFDEMEDIGTLMRMRPLGSMEFPTDSLKDIPADSLKDDTQAAVCLYTLERLFGGDEGLLANFLCALALCARDKRQRLRILLPDAPEEATGTARRLMEIVLRCMDEDDAVRVSYASMDSGSAAIPYTAVFASGSGSAAGGPGEILVNLIDRSMYMPMGVQLAADERLTEQAQALLQHDLEGALRAKSRVRAPKAAAERREEAAAFSKGMTLKKYFADWRAALESKRKELTDEGFAACAAGEWSSFLNGAVSASELMDNEQFLTELNGILTMIRKDKLETALALDGDTMSDMLVLLLDSINWRQTDLTRPQTARLIRTVTACAHVLDESRCEGDCLAACRAVNHLLTGPALIHEALDEMALLEELNPARFDAVQDCLRQYVQDRLTADFDVIDEMLAAAAMLAFVRFTDGIPDLRLTDKLTERIEAQSGQKAARKFQHMLDKLRQHLRSKKAGNFLTKDMKLLLMISCALLMLILGITAWFMLAY